jgi:hypothetical protein
MLKKFLPICALLLLLPVLGPAELAAQPAQTPPTLVVRLASLDNLFENLKLLSGLLGKDDIAGKLDQSIKTRLGPRGLYGIDGQRPIGFYARVGKDISDLSGVLMVPVRGDKEFKEMLAGLGWEVSSAGKDGIHTVKQNLLPVDLQYRISAKYAYVSLAGSDTLLTANLIEPQKIFTGKSQAALSLTLRLDQIPADARGFFLDTLKDGLGKLDAKEGETSKGPKALQAVLAKEMQRILESVFKDGEEVNADINIDAKTKQLAVDLTLRPKAKSKLAENIAKLGQRQTLFAGVLHKDAAMNALVNCDVPPELRGALGAVVEDMVKQVTSDLKDESKQKQAVQLLEAIKPSLTANHIDAALSLRGPHKSKQFTMVAGLKLHLGDKLLTALVALLKDLPQSEQKLIHLNVDKVGEVGIHKLEMQGSFDGVTKQMFGDSPIYVAFRNDACFLALGEEGLAAIKDAVAAKAEVQPAVQFDMSAARLSATMGKAAGAAGDDARLRFTLDGGAMLSVRFTVALSALQIFAQEK